MYGKKTNKLSDYRNGVPLQPAPHRLLGSLLEGMHILGNTQCLESGEPPGLKTQVPSPSHYQLCRIFGISKALVVPLLLRGR